MTSFSPHTAEVSLAQEHMIILAKEIKIIIIVNLIIIIIILIINNIRCKVQQTLRRSELCFTVSSYPNMERGVQPCHISVFDFLGESRGVVVVMLTGQE